MRLRNERNESIVKVNENGAEASTEPPAPMVGSYKSHLYVGTRQLIVLRGESIP